MANAGGKKPTVRLLLPRGPATNLRPAGAHVNHLYQTRAKAKNQLARAIRQGDYE
jgi:hypothetical protein